MGKELDEKFHRARPGSLCLEVLQAPSVKPAQPVPGEFGQEYKKRSDQLKILVSTVIKAGMVVAVSSTSEHHLESLELHTVLDLPRT